MARNIDIMSQLVLLWAASNDRFPAANPGAIAN
jgi:hypothetical protein